MSRHNYSQYANKKRDEETRTEVQAVEAVVDETITTAPEVKMVEETVETVTLPETVTGTVVDCVKLNVRVAPDATADIACVVSANTEMIIDVDKSTDEWFCVCTAAGVEGYCMRKYMSTTL